VKDLNQIVLNARQAVSSCSTALHFETPEICWAYTHSTVGDKKKNDVWRFKTQPRLKTLPFMLRIKNSMTVFRYNVWIKHNGDELP
jgi:hypothetical protein